MASPNTTNGSAINRRSIRVTGHFANRAPRSGIVNHVGNDSAASRIVTQIIGKECGSEIPLPVRGSGNGNGLRQYVGADAIFFPVVKKEALIAPVVQLGNEHWPAKCTAELVELEGRPPGREVLARYRDAGRLL